MTKTILVAGTKTTCKACNGSGYTEQIEREITCFASLVTALWHVFRWCESRRVFRFQIKEVEEANLFQWTKAQHSRFVDWPHFGILKRIDVRNEKGDKKSGYYEFDVLKAYEFFADNLAIPTRVWKNMTTGAERPDPESFRTLSQIPKLEAFLDLNREYVVRYREVADAENKQGKLL